MFPATRRTASSNCRIGRGVGLGQLGRRHANRFGRQLGLVDPGRIVQHGRQALFLHVAADALDHLLRRKRLAKDLDRPLPARFADDVSLRAEPCAQLGHRRADILLPAIDATDIQGGGIHGLYFQGQANMRQCSLHN